MGEQPRKAAGGGDERAAVARLPLGENLTGRGLVLVTLGLLALGVVMVYSAVATVAPRGEWYNRVGFRHMVFAAAAAGLLIALWRLNAYRLNAGKRFPWVAALLLAAALACGGLVFVPGVGHSIGGYFRWIRIGPEKYAIGFQPSEIIKIALVVFLSAWLTRQAVNVRSFGRTFVPAMVLIGGCMALVITQDFGTAMLIAASAGATLLLAGVPWYHLGGVLASAAVGFYFFVVRDPYRWSRIEAMLDPWSRDNPAAYQAGQSILAVMTGGWTGKGLGLGTVKQGYLPEDSTDFIFSVCCEEMGLVGGILVLALLGLWIVLAWRAAARAEDPFGRVLAGSLGFLVGMQAVLHVAVDLVVVPPKGLGLPFVSAGGTSLLIMAAATAMIVSVSSRRHAALESNRL
ncbi:MAG TPA: FtsW/RodA/SpoVE family cell cycle protein [Phycisphaerae bacterium]|nr:FtsW/RodA/SpoVE family cell cycle protein [Phycisphaerae bacterium]